MTDTPSPPRFFDVDWSTLPAPIDDGACQHLAGSVVPSIVLPATDGSNVTLAALSGRTVVFFYPLTGKPGVALPEGWDAIPGARGCTPQSCSFRDHFSELRASGATHVFGVSAQVPSYQREVAERLHLPFVLLSDAGLALTQALNLPTFVVEGQTLIKRLAMVLDEGRISTVFYPVFPPDRNAGDVLAWLKANPR